MIIDGLVWGLLHWQMGHVWEVQESGKRDTVQWLLVQCTFSCCEACEAWQWCLVERERETTIRARKPYPTTGGTWSGATGCVALAAVGRCQNIWRAGSNRSYGTTGPATGHSSKFHAVLSSPLPSVSWWSSFVLCSPLLVFACGFFAERHAKHIRLPSHAAVLLNTWNSMNYCRSTELNRYANAGKAW